MTLNQYTSMTINDSIETNNQSFIISNFDTQNFSRMQYSFIGTQTVKN